MDAYKHQQWKLPLDKRENMLIRMTLKIIVPMAPKGTLLRLFRLHPFPLPMFETHHLMIDAKDDILAISSTVTRYNVQLSSTDLLSCHRMNQVFMCDSLESSWLGALYMQRFELVHSLCKSRVVPLKSRSIKCAWDSFWFIPRTRAPQL